MKKRREKISKQKPITIKNVKQNTSIPNLVSSQVIQEQETGDISYQGILHQVLVGVMKLLLENSTAKTLHSMDDTHSFIQTQAEAYIEEELSRKLSGDPDDTSPHKMYDSSQIHRTCIIF